MNLPGSCDVTILGAGPAGSSSAALLSQAGFSVVVLEKEQFPRFVIGESLLPRCMDLLTEANLLEAAKSRNYIVKRGALFLRGEERCDFNFAMQHTKGWEWTWQVPRADFDQTLADAVVARGVPFAWKHEVVAVDFSGQPTVTYVDPDGARRSIRSRFVLDASGYGRVLPRLLDLDKPSGFPPRKAVFAHMKGDCRKPGPDENRIWISCEDSGAWTWVIPFSSGLTSFGVVGGLESFEGYPAQAAECLRAIISHPNYERLHEASFAFEPRTISAYACTVKKLHGKGFCMVGNATEFLDPVFSSGVTLALESANRACKSLVRELHGETVDWETDYAGYMRRGTDVFRTYVTNWYSGTLPRLFFDTGDHEQVKNMICSVLAGYVWDSSNPFVASHERKIAQVARLTA
ncbi:MAG TPA: NAD(P)/FAD-dependent oxidoreductase [Myxococcales bacterium]|nr:NAD(P)/FAD-dependent oxidoreductase [Myxococcales bacterium]